MSKSIEEDKSTHPLLNNLLYGQVAIVTGGSRGIGRATALRLAEAGSNIVITYLRNAKAANEVAVLAREMGVKALVCKSDVSNESEFHAVIEKTIEEFGHVDVLVANAGIWEGAPIEKMSESIWDKVLNANLKGTWVSCRAVVPQMRKQGHGSIVIVSSTAGQRGEAGYSNYAASKGGQISLTKSLAIELAPHIRINCVAPGWVDTDLNAPVFCDPAFKEKITNAIPLKRIATADDVALSVIFLASNWSQHLTGEVLNVNGGAVLCG